jgi:hypothetical protein
MAVHTLVGSVSGTASGSLKPVLWRVAGSTGDFNDEEAAVVADEGPGAGGCCVCTVGLASYAGGLDLCDERMDENRLLKADIVRCARGLGVKLSVQNLRKCFSVVD